MPRSMIFYYPFPVPDNQQYGESMRLANMRRAFEDLGYEVDDVTGYASQRAEAIRRLKANVSKGREYEFAYAEASTWPMVLHKRNISRPFIDASFFTWCRAHNIPVGLFYRDVYWRFPKAHLPWWFTWKKRIVAIPCYWYEWFVYRACVQHLFLPSMGMTGALPTTWPQGRVSAAPPGAVLPELDRPCEARKEQGVELLYVGNITPGRYDIRPLLQIVRQCQDARLTLCCRQNEWNAYSDYYTPLLCPRVRVVHESGEGLAPLYARADAFALIREANAYLDFAVPTKVYESVGYALPIITLAGTEAARIVFDDDLGWVVADIDEAASLVSSLALQPEQADAKRKRLETVRRTHAWTARAQAIADTLGSYRSRA